MVNFHHPFLMRIIFGRIIMMEFTDSIATDEIIIRCACDKQRKKGDYQSETRFY